jgi:hypothetical protein
VLDPACGSGHILVVAYDVLKAIYLERGYQPRAIPRLILEKNLYGLDIDDRAAQMAGFALLMKARADDRRLFATDDAGNLQPPKLNVLSLQESKGLERGRTRHPPGPVQGAARHHQAALVETFEHAKTFGSLIQMKDMVTMQSWMFLSSYMSMRERLLQDRTIFTMAHLGARAFSEISGEVVQTTAFVLQRQNQCSYSPAFFRLVEGREEDKEAALRSNRYRFDATIQNDFGKIPGSPIAYWVGANVRDAFVRMRPFRELGSPKVGMQTSNNSRYLRYWWEIDFVEFNDPGKSENPKWIIYLKGGPFRRWYGNLDYLLRYNGNANYILVQPNATVLPISRLNDPKCTWTDLTSGAFNCRLAPNRSFHDISGHCFYPKIEDQLFLLGATNAKPFDYLLSLINATFHFQVGDVGKIPVPESNRVEITSNVEVLVALSKRDWDGQETSWEFSYHPWVKSGFYGSSLSATWLSFSGEIGEAVKCMQQLEEQNNRLFIEAYGLQNELSPDVPEAQVTLTRADREKDSQRLISYAIGCMMGRYSLDEPGLIYAHAGNVGFDTPATRPFRPTPTASCRSPTNSGSRTMPPTACANFCCAVWGSDTLDENMAWLAESLGQKGNETPDETIRRYLSSSFFKDHLQTYKKRPIYWLFSSGKQGAFQALVYLHRYNESTLARMRAEYVVPLTGKMQSRIEMLEKDAESASTAARNKLGKEIEKLRKKHVELLAYDEKLRHFADMRISLDLDDGVKVNYGKFGDLLAEVKAVTGGAGDD